MAVELHSIAKRASRVPMLDNMRDVSGIQHGFASVLGLAVVQGVAHGHGGAINVLSAPGQGTRFQIFLPVVPCDSAKTGDSRKSELETSRRHRTLPHLDV